MVCGRTGHLGTYKKIKAYVFPKQYKRNRDLNLSVWGRTQDDNLVRHTLKKKEEYDIPPIISMSSGKDSICVGTQKGLYRISTKGKEIQQWYIKNKMLAVHSTQKGDCWFVSDSEQMGVVYANGEEIQWDMPTRIGEISMISKYKEKGYGYIVAKAYGL